MREMAGLNSENFPEKTGLWNSYCTSRKVQLELIFLTVIPV